MSKALIKNDLKFLGDGKGEPLQKFIKSMKVSVKVEETINYRSNARLREGNDISEPKVEELGEGLRNMAFSSWTCSRKTTLQSKGPTKRPI